ncbi:hypothetical protein [Mycolicibacterium fortuitum]|jgi:hypothetical protein|uniref:hypothetical protein n=4 Tax=Mycobacteriaceae TaxID=1762 RepID=UPI0007E9D4B7|nr:hypothetical protein [Mycolicibacterium fortuitum]OBG42953.1 hypothetical protein A5670_14655 [Mycolicibacterium fortuitum]OBI76120.1 hypothetical protein A5664_23050 [Mycolicibacterium fortuitum]TPW94983.1 hypothetical protein FKW78_13125 [Mycolicibacterium fortuitum]UBV22701.1 hypothetical protein H8Z59_05885 [Mycolicibacterium fortuitum]
MSVTEDEIDAQFRRGPAISRLVPEQREMVPASWLPVFDAADPSARAVAALSLWTGGAQTLMPEFWAVLQEFLVDAWVGLRDDRPVLVYVVEFTFRYADVGYEQTQRTVAVWVGEPPAPEAVTRYPELWSAAPAELVDFYRTVHGSYTVPDGQSFGLLAVDAMPTLADVFEELDVDPLQYESGPQPDRLLMVTQIYSGTRLCLSPELPAGHGIVVRGYDDPDPSSKDFATLLDELVLVRFEVD